MADGFLGRWARRKAAVREGKPVPEQPAVAPPTPAAGAKADASTRQSGEERSILPPPPGEGRGEGARAAERSASQSTSPAPPPPTVEEASALTPQSDFRRFVQPGVPPDVRNAAVKQLWADPHFNIMDGLDTYIDDYSKPDPIPPEMLRQLASAQFLKLFEEKEEEKDEEKDRTGDEAAPGREVADDPAAESVAQSGTAGPSDPAVHPPAEDHADPDLRLQQDDAPGREAPGAGDR